MPVKDSKKLEKGLTNKQALERFPYKKGMGEKRGFSYNKKTGEAKWI